MISLIEVEELFASLKDNLEFDSDITAIVKVLNYELSLDKNLALKNWFYLLTKYDIKNTMYDIDYKPLIKDFPLQYIKIYSLKEFLNLNLPNSIKQLIYYYTFNSFNKEGIIELLKELIKENKLDKELEILDTIILYSKEFKKEYFDLTELLKQIINIHISLNKINKEYLEKLIKKAPTKKDQALLKTLLID